MAKKSAKYEAMVVYSLKNGEEALKALVEKFKERIERHAEAVEVNEDWGKRRLAYEIDGLTDGSYVLINFHMDPAALAECDRVLRITGAVVRFMIVRRDDME